MFLENVPDGSHFEISSEPETPEILIGVSKGKLNEPSNGFIIFINIDQS